MKLLYRLQINFKTRFYYNKDILEYPYCMFTLTITQHALDHTLCSSSHSVSLSLQFFHYKTDLQNNDVAKKERMRVLLQFLFCFSCFRLFPLVILFPFFCTLSYVFYLVLFLFRISLLLFCKYFPLFCSLFCCCYNSCSFTVIVNTLK